MDIRFDQNGLVPAIVQHWQDGRVLMLGYMNEESLQRTRESGHVWFYSRSRQKLWEKGESSGHYLVLKGLYVDCDGDSLLVKADPLGPTCHTGQDSCFFEHLVPEEPAFSLRALYDLLEGRKNSPKEGSYTSYLFDKGLDKILKKVGEESTEVVIAAKGGDRQEALYEIADLAYHLLVLMVQLGISTGDVARELASRHLVDKKQKQETSRAE